MIKKPDNNEQLILEHQINLQDMRHSFTWLIDLATQYECTQTKTLLECAQRAFTHRIGRQLHKELYFP